MSNYDARETLDHSDCRESLLKQLRNLIAVAKTDTTRSVNSLAEVSSRGIATLSDFAQLPVLRKSEPLDAQRDDLPFGGLTTKPASAFAHVF